MLNVGGHDGPRPKCHFSSTVLPAFVNHDQIPNKKNPFSTISARPFYHTVRLILPQNAATSPKPDLEESVGTLQYAKVYMKLRELIEGDFFNNYIKTGNVLMLSEGLPGRDHVFSIVEGVLRLEVDKPTYERMGLGGVSIPNEGRKHLKARYAIEINLRLPSMVRGKKGFERIIWAFKNVLNHAATWLFYDLKGTTDGSGPISTHEPKVRTIEHISETMDAVIVPQLPDDLQQDNYEFATDLLEWASLAMNGSPRLQQQDKIDPYLSQYRVRATDLELHTEEHVIADLTRICWRGFIPSFFVKDIFLAALKASGTSWFAMTIVAFDGQTCCFLQNNHHTTTWEYQD